MAETAVKVYYGNLMMRPDVSRVLACLHEKDLKYELININKGRPPVPVDSLSLQEKATSRVPGPAFEDGRKTLFGSRGICRHLSEEHTGKGNKYLLGRDALERAFIEQWLRSEEHSFDPPSWMLLLHSAFPATSTELEVVEECERELAEVLDVYNQRLRDAKYLAGNDFSLADLAHLPNAYYLATSKEWRYLIDSNKYVKRWVGKICERAAWVKAAATVEGLPMGRTPLLLSHSATLLHARRGSAEEEPRLLLPTRQPPDRPPPPPPPPPPKSTTPPYVPKSYDASNQPPTQIEAVTPTKPGTQKSETSKPDVPRPKQASVETWAAPGPPHAPMHGMGTAKEMPEAPKATWVPVNKMEESTLHKPAASTSNTDQRVKAHQEPSVTSSEGPTSGKGEAPRPEEKPAEERERSIPSESRGPILSEPAGKRRTETDESGQRRVDEMDGSTSRELTAMPTTTQPGAPTSTIPQTKDQVTGNTRKEATLSTKRLPQTTEQELKEKVIIMPTANKTVSMPTKQPEASSQARRAEPTKISMPGKEGAVSPQPGASPEKTAAGSPPAKAPPQTPTSVDGKPTPRAGSSSPPPPPPPKGDHSSPSSGPTTGPSSR